MQLLTLLLVVAAAQAVDVDKLTPVYRTMPGNLSYTWGEWLEIMAAQELKPDPDAEYPGTEPQPEDAGVAPALPKGQPQGRVIGGSPAAQGQFPWQAAIVIDGSGFCGGSLISPTIILTAAHCTYGAWRFQVTLGTVNLQGSQWGAVTQVTSTQIRHQSYNQQTLNNDISLLRLSSPVATSNNIRTIRLPRSSQASTSFEGSTVIVSGFGKTTGNGGLSSYLMYASLTVIGNTQCAPYFGNSINAAKICTLGANGRNPCNGDSGGPLVVQEGDGYTQVGLVSFGSQGCQASWPAVFTRLTAYLSWISGNAGLAIRP